MSNIAGASQSTATQNTDKNFQKFTGELCRLNHSCKNDQGSSKQDISTSSKNTGDMSFEGFQDNVGQQYDLPEGQQESLVNLLIDMLDELLGAVMSTLEGNRSADEPSQTAAETTETTDTANTNNTETKPIADKETSVDNKDDLSNDQKSTDEKKMGACPFKFHDEGATAAATQQGQQS